MRNGHCIKVFNQIGRHSTLEKVYFARGRLPGKRLWFLLIKVNDTLLCCHGCSASQCENWSFPSWSEIRSRPLSSLGCRFTCAKRRQWVQGVESYTSQPGRYVLTERWCLPAGSHGVSSQDTVIDIVTALRTSDLISWLVTDRCFLVFVQHWSGVMWVA
jgi:hypothetical protein